MSTQSPDRAPGDGAAPAGTREVPLASGDDARDDEQDHTGADAVPTDEEGR